jgi:hypothetical protein
MHQTDSFAKRRDQLISEATVAFASENNSAQLPEDDISHGRHLTRILESVSQENDNLNAGDFLG